jgi:PilZ domain
VDLGAIRGHTVPFWHSTEMWDSLFDLSFFLTILAFPLLIIDEPRRPLLRAGESMNHLDRRLSRRYSMRIPIRFRGLEDTGGFDGYTGETANISRTGLFFTTKIPLLLGTTLELALRIPRELSGSAKSVVHCVGWIVRTEFLEDGSVGYGTRIDLRQSAGAVVVAEETVEAMAAGSNR